MVGSYFIHNDDLKPIEMAQVSLDDINFVYGYGVYETLKVRQGKIFFVEMHAERLLNSAKIVHLSHQLTQDMIVNRLKRLVESNKIAEANIKVLLISGTPPRKPQFYAMTLNPLFPKRSDYSRGATAISVEAERQFPQAKSLNMMTSAIMFGRARQAGAYDALLTNRYGHITEGTRTNIFATDGERIFTPPLDTILFGVTMRLVSRVIIDQGYQLEEREIPRDNIKQWKGLFLTSTSSKIMPLRAVDDIEFEIPPITKTLMRAYNLFLDEYAQQYR